jgi:predicted nucleotidyltransferase
MRVQRQDIEDLVNEIAREFQPEQVVLFGSHAYGTLTEDSNVDLLVVLPFAGRGSAKTLEIVHRLNPRIPVDIVVRTPEDLHRRLSWNDFFLREITEKGEVLYESPRA